MTSNTPEASAPSGSKLILVVDDDALNRKVVQTQLKVDGYEVLAVNSGQAALDAIALRRPDLVLLDLMMPGMDGFEVVRRLRAQPDAERLPIVAVTAIDSSGARARLAAAGVAIIPKPIDRWRLKACIAHMLSGGAAGDLP